jgi:hypothetical protein
MALCSGANIFSKRLANIANGLSKALGRGILIYLSSLAMDRAEAQSFRNEAGTREPVSGIGK